MQRYFVEYIGSLFFFYVCIAVGNPLAVGGALALAKYMGDPISGGHFNPAVTVMLILARKMPLATLAPYVVAQLLAAITVVQLVKFVR